MGGKLEKDVKSAQIERNIRRRGVSQEAAADSKQHGLCTLHKPNSSQHGQVAHSDNRAAGRRSDNGNLCTFINFNNFSLSIYLHVLHVFTCIYLLLLINNQWLPITRNHDLKIK